jgi:hypothetical protein
MMVAAAAAAGVAHDDDDGKNMKRAWGLSLRSSRRNDGRREAVPCSILVFGSLSSL